MFRISPVIQTISLQKRPVDVLRLDLIHPHYGGNKIFKLKYNIESARKEAKEGIVTFGGAHSNHIFATAAYCMEKKLKCAGIIRGEEMQTPTITAAREFGMELQFVSRTEYNRVKNSSLPELFPGYFHVPEGGNNAEGVKGCSEILNGLDFTYDRIFCACGTAATFSGLSISAGQGTKVTGISVLKGQNSLIEEANKWMRAFNKGTLPVAESLDYSSVLGQYHLGGYAAFSDELVSFKRWFERQCAVPLDHVYTAKLFYAVHDLIKNKKLEGEKILVIHSGGLQGNAAFEKRYGLRD